MVPEGDRFNAHLSDNWMQGRTAYGGASAALALAAALRAYPDLPPLRSAQFAFVAPLGGDIAFIANLIRRGRSATFVRVDAFSDDMTGLTSLLLFASERESTIVIEPERVELPPKGDPVIVPAHVAFAQNFEQRRAGQVVHGFDRWARLAERDSLHPDVEMIAIADVLPAAAIANAGRPVPLSTITWQVNLTCPRPQTSDGWWLARSIADQASNGLSSQSMWIHDAEGALAATATQQVALFA
jgi:acyl-CoA thioesterase